MSETLMDRIAELRSKVASGTITDDELREAIQLCRKERTSSLLRRVVVKEAAKVPDGAALLAQLMGDNDAS